MVLADSFPCGLFFVFAGCTWKWQNIFVKSLCIRQILIRVGDPQSGGHGE